ncbi:MAG: hypothetical protein Q7R39_02220 [Dehalococcoidia bacterium]|nr:hypothetical protein [Dehalococcoidia bacterium]
MLQKWFEAMEDGRAYKWFPDPKYPIAIPTETCDLVIEHIETEYAKELKAWAFTDTAGSYTHGPGFDRLKPPQRLALCQELRTVLKGDPYPCRKCGQPKSDHSPACLDLPTEQD